LNATILNAAIHLLNTLLPMLYALAALAYAVDFFRDDRLATKATRPMLVLVIVLHAMYLALRTLSYKHIPLASISEVMTTTAFAVTVVYYYVEFRTGTHKTGMFLLTFSFLFQTVSSAFISEMGVFPEVLKSPLFGVHTGSAVLGYTAFAVSAIYGVLYLLLYHDLKSNRFGIVYRHLPSLDLLSTMSRRAAVLGLLFLTITISLGTLWGYLERVRFPHFYRDPKPISTVIVWVVYAIGAVLHYGFGWTGRRTVHFSLFGFALLVISIMAVRLWIPSFHVGFEVK